MALHDHGLCQTSVNGDWLSQWETAIFDPLQSRHPLTDRERICHKWLCRVGDPFSCTTGAYRRMGEI